jgi:hypothetical protein
MAVQLTAHEDNRDRSAGFFELLALLCLCLFALGVVRVVKHFRA